MYLDPLHVPNILSFGLVWLLLGWVELDGKEHGHKELAFVGWKECGGPALM